MVFRPGQKLPSLSKVRSTNSQNSRPVNLTIQLAISGSLPARKRTAEPSSNASFGTGFVSHPAQTTMV